VSRLKFFNPNDTIAILKEKIRFTGKDYKTDKEVLNPSLIFNKLIPHTGNKEDKKKHFDLVKNETKKFAQKEDLIKESLLKEKLKKAVESLKNQGYQTCNFESKVAWRMIIGLGGIHPHETSMTFHHIYGIPYIPGSAVKGVTRHWVVWRYFENKEDEALKKDEDFKNIFGTQEEQGKVIFFDAYPEGEIKLAVDIMNPHYSDYYSEGKPPADWQKPKPIPFLTVEDTEFCFFLASKEEPLLKKAESWLKEALKEYGIGAKTSLGYGIFEE